MQLNNNDGDEGIQYVLDDTPQTGCVFRPGRHLIRAEYERRAKNNGMGWNVTQKDSCWNSGITINVLVQWWMEYRMLKSII